MEKINVAELLKDCPKGMELDCTIYNNVEFEGISNNKDWPIAISVEGYPEVLNPYGCISYRDYAKCVIFPKGKTTWEGFVPPCQFKDGDIVVNNSSKNKKPFIYKGKNKDYYECYVGLTVGFSLIKGSSTWVDISCELRPATEEEKAELFQAIKDNGYKWNEETKTLEKLPKFRVGDRIKEKTKDICGEIINVYKTKYNVKIGDKGLYVYFHEQDNWELAPNKFDITTLVPFESRVLVRDYIYEEWKASFWGYLTNNCYKYNYDTIRGNYKQCIPYEGNEHLLGTTNDCDEYFKIWE